MKIQVNKTVTFIALGLVTTALAACSTTNSNTLGGAAGQPTATTLPAEPSASSPEPTTPPIPETYGHIIFVSDRDGDRNLYITSPDGQETARLTDFSSEEPHISPDGTRVAFVSNVNDNTDIYVLEISTGSITRITDAPQKDSAPSWSPDGTRIAFESFRDGNFEIYVSNADGSSPTRLTNDPAGDNSPVWSPVGNEIAFVSNRFGNSDIFLMSLNGTPATLTTNSAPDSAPAWSPDGSTIAFQTYSGELSNICTIGRDGLNQRCVTGAPSDYGSPVWSPDGRFIAANAKQSTGYGIDVINVQDGSKLQLSSAGIDPRGDPAWSPEGTRLVFSAQSNGNVDLFTVLFSSNEFTNITATNSFDDQAVWGAQ